jgi:hypothetical protein
MGLAFSAQAEEAPSSALPLTLSSLGRGFQSKRVLVPFQLIEAMNWAVLQLPRRDRVAQGNYAKQLERDEAPKPQHPR